MSFPESFWWGAGASSDAADGAAPGSDVKDWIDHGRLPDGGNGTDFAHAFADDLARFSATGLANLRYVLDWTRLEPVPGQHDAAIIDHTLLVLETARDAGVSVWGCLHDGSLPGWFSVDEHGFSDRRSSTYYWARHVEFVGETFGHLVHGWVPVFEPNRWAVRGWLDGARPPGRRDDAEGFTGALEGILLASIDAAKRLRQDGHPVATAHWIAPVFPARLQPGAPPAPEAEVMASVADEALRGCWLRMLVEETLVVPGRAPIEVPGAREAFDVIGLTYQHALAVRGDGALLPYPQTLAVGEDGQVPWAEGLALALHQTAEDLPGRPLLIAGVNLTTSDERRREAYLRELLGVAEEAIDGGIDLQGLWWDTPIDPAPGPPTPGLFDQTRTPRPAADLLASVTAGGPIPA